jgi:hypothetical protein
MMPLMASLSLSNDKNSAIVLFSKGLLGGGCRRSPKTKIDRRGYGMFECVIRYVAGRNVGGIQ